MAEESTRRLLQRIINRHRLDNGKIHEGSTHLWLSAYANGYRVAVRANSNGTFYLTLCQINDKLPAVLGTLPSLDIGIGWKNNYPAARGIPSEEVLNAILVLFRREASLHPK